MEIVTEEVGCRQGERKGEHNAHHPNCQHLLLCVLEHGYVHLDSYHEHKAEQDYIRHCGQNADASWREEVRLKTFRGLPPRGTVLTTPLPARAILTSAAIDRTNKERKVRALGLW